jgi:hypothetical protein
MATNKTASLSLSLSPVFTLTLTLTESGKSRKFHHTKIYKFSFHTHLVVEGVQYWAHTHVTQRLVHLHFFERIAGATNNLDSHLTGHQKKLKKSSAALLPWTTLTGT